MIGTYHILSYTPKQCKVNGWFQNGLQIVAYDRDSSFSFHDNFNWEIINNIIRYPHHYRIMCLMCIAFNDIAIAKCCVDNIAYHDLSRLVATFFNDQVLTVANNVIYNCCSSAKTNGKTVYLLYTHYKHVRYQNGENPFWMYGVVVWVNWMVAEYLHTYAEFTWWKCTHKRIACAANCHERDSTIQCTAESFSIRSVKWQRETKSRLQWSCAERIVFAFIEVKKTLIALNSFKKSCVIVIHRYK